MSRCRPALWPLAVLIGLLIGTPVVLGIVDLLGSDDGFPELEIGEAPQRYRVVYRVEDLSGGGPTVTTEEVVVDRPFRGRVTVRSGEPPGQGVLSVTTSDLARTGSRSRDGAPQVLVVEPDSPGGDVRLDALLDDALAFGLVNRVGETREVAGRECVLFRVAVLSPAGTDEGDYRELCVDDRGLVLAEDLVVAERLARARQAVAIEVDPELPDDLDVSAAPGDPALELVRFELPEPPSGFEHRGRFAFDVPAGRASAVAGAPAPVPSVAALDVWTRGADFVALLNGRTEDGSAPFDDRRRVRAVDLGDAGAGEALVTLGRAEVRADLGDGRFVRVLGTLPLADLATLARRLEPADPAGTAPHPGS